MCHRFKQIIGLMVFAGHKITLNDVVRFNTLNPDNLPACPVLINITASVREDPRIDHEDVIIDVVTRNYIDQGIININLTCYHVASAQHLMNVTASVQKDSVLYINGELIITEDDKIVHIRSVSFSEYQKLNTILKNSPTQLSWESQNQPEPDPQNTAAQTIATKVKASIRRKKITPASKPYFRTGSHPKVFAT
ncbi:hypothetical protein C2G38_2045050 [Gigaspora rosea]|uniref:Uncharacterized protein n=1 Tax=Gigaspora rosea TaxID=44941 RepID=A0A397UE69_9GLOM|nr:hypothetical protein C2G38_2045050 [Gigaspora rosea]